ncbi:MAG: hypothetical protein J7K40_04900 [candidate division Zixibacteria bacterium]|nr:hypothetical protein [candidate division Zixibacteria bacterium]
MPYCPRCRCEYEDDIDICPDCNERLVDSLTIEIMLNYYDDEVVNEDWVPIALLASSRYADMLLSGLRAKDIPAVIIDSSVNAGKSIHCRPASFQSVDSNYTLIVPKKYVFEADREAESILGDKWEEAQFNDEDEKRNC